MIHSQQQTGLRGGDQPGLGPQSILLIVDDNAINRKVLGAQLAAEGIEVLEASDGVEALRVLASHQVDGVISDILMPNMDGYHFCQELRRSEKFAALPFIFYTSTFLSPSDEKSVTDLGADNFVRMPAAVSVLLASLSAAAANAERRPAAPRTESEVRKEYSERLVAKLEAKNIELVASLDRLQASEERLRAIVQAEPECVLVICPDGKLLEINPAGLAMFQADSLEELCRRPLLSLMPPAYHQSFTQLHQQVIRGETATLEFEVIGLKGSQLWLEIRAAPLRDKLGAIIALLGITRDISQWKRAAQDLLHSEAILAQAQRIAKIGSWDMNLLTHELFWSDQVYEIFGITRASFGANYESFMERVHPLDRDRMIKSRLRSLKGDGRLDTEHRILLPNGAIKFVHEIAYRTQDTDGRPTHLIGTVQDITERKRQEARFRRLVDSNVQGVMFWNKKGEVTGANDAFLQIVGYSREDLEEGRIAWIAMSTPEHSPQDRNWLGNLTNLGNCEAIEREYVRKDGSRVSVLVGAAAFEDNPDEGVCFMIDLTERKKLEEQSIHAQRMESIGTLAGGIAHDLNNVLAPIMMSAEILKEYVTDAEALTWLDTLQISANRGAGLVKQVLSFARGVEGMRIPVNLLSLARDLVKVVKETFPKTITVSLASAKELWLLTGDPTQIHQIFLNLCVNARDAMPGGGTISVSLENIVLDETFAAMNPNSHPGHYLLAKVKDTGTGIPFDVQARIFEPFFTTKAIGKGTGLGLSTTLAIVKSHGGFINLYSEVGKGTEFKIYLPANPAENAAADSAIEQTQMPRGEGELILVVDDEKPIRDIVRRTLERFGYRVLVAVNGAEAVALFAKHESKIAVVLTDMAMPVMDGRSTIVALKALNPAVKIIGSSGLADNGDMVDGVGGSIHGFIQKPYTAETMLIILRKVLDEPSGQRISFVDQSASNRNDLDPFEAKT